jgi:hypothetical protein
MHQMQNDQRWLIMPLIMSAVLVVSACGQKAPATTAVKPATIEKIAGSNLSRVILTAEAARRLDLRTEPIRDVLESGSMRRVMPYAAIVYDIEGATWAYTSPQPLTFVRHGVSVDSIKGNLAFLVDGPPSGTDVVTVGVAELYGAEFGIGK